MDFSFVIALPLLAAFVVLMEAIVWRIFTKRIAHITFPQDADASMLGFFTVARMRIVALVHTVFLLTTLSILLAYQW